MVRLIDQLPVVARKRQVALGPTEKWAQLRAESLEIFPGEIARFETQQWPFRMADIWPHPNVPGDQAIAFDKPAFCLEAHPGILVVSESQRKQTLPIIGMRALARNRLNVLLQFQNPTLGHLTIEA